MLPADRFDIRGSERKALHPSEPFDGIEDLEDGQPVGVKADREVVCLVVVSNSQDSLERFKSRADL